MLSEQAWELIFACNKSHNIISVNEDVQICVKRCSSSTSKLQNERKIYNKLAHLQGTCIPVLIGFETKDNVDFLVTSLIKGESVDSETIKNQELLKKIVDCLQRIHAGGVVHCDLKPEHIIIQVNNVAIVDFDLASLMDEPISKDYEILRYLKEPNKYHSGEFRGTNRYASVNSHLGGKPTPAWDYESLFYIALSLLRGAPWSGIGENIAVGDKKIMYAFENPALKELITCTHRDKEQETAAELFWSLVQQLLSTEPKAPKPQSSPTSKGSLEQRQDNNFHMLPDDVSTRSQRSKRSFSAMQDENNNDEQIMETVEHIDILDDKSKQLVSRAVETEVHNIFQQNNIKCSRQQVASDYEYYSAFRKKAKTVEVDIYGQGCSCEEFSKSFLQGTFWKMHLKRKQNTPQLPNQISPASWTVVGEIICLTPDFVGQRAEAMATKFAQLEADLVRYQCQYSNTPHPLDIATQPIWGCVVVASGHDMTRTVIDVAKTLTHFCFCVPRLRVLALCDRLLAVQIKSDEIDHLFGNRSYTSELSSLLKRMVSDLIPKLVSQTVSAAVKESFAQTVPQVLSELTTIHTTQTNPHVTGMDSWSVDQVAAFFKSLHLKNDYTAILHEQGIDGEALCYMEDSHMQNLHIVVGDSIKIKKAIQGKK